MAGRVVRRMVILLALAGVVALGRAGLPGSAGGYLCAAALFLLGFPGFWVATFFRPKETLADRAALGFCVGHGVFAILALLYHTAGIGLGAMIPAIILLAPAAAFLPGGTDPSGRRYGEAAIILIGGIVLASATGARVGYRTDAYDHLGGARWMIERGDVLPHEYFHTDRVEELDPRKGTNNTFFALLCLVTRIDPVEGWGGFRLFHVFIFLAAFHMLARAALPGGMTPWIATLIFSLLHRGGPAGQWFSTAGYPGGVGYVVFLTTMALVITAARRSERIHPLLPLLLGFGVTGIHIFHGVLTGLALSTLLAVLLVTSRFRKNVPSLIRTMAFFAVGCAPLFLFRMIAAYNPGNPLHIHPQGILLLPAGMAILGYRELIASFGLAGWVSLGLLPFVRAHGRPVEPGEAFLAGAWVVTLFLVANPILFPFLEERLGYLMRRFTLLVPWPLILGGVIGHLFTRKITFRVALPALIAGTGVLVSFSSSLAGSGKGSPFQSFDDPDGREFITALRQIDEVLPPGSTVLTDPVTGYLLYGRTMLLPVAVVDQHSSPNDARAGHRIVDSQRALHPRWGKRGCDESLERYGVSYVLINERYQRPFTMWNAFPHPETIHAGRLLFDSRPERFEPLPAPEGLHLYRVIGEPGGNEAIDVEGIKKPDGERIDREMIGGIILENSSVDRPALQAGETVVITTSWFVHHKAEQFIPQRLIIYGLPTGNGEKPSGKPWHAGQLGGKKQPYLLWEEGDRVVLQTGFSIPLDCAAGKYTLLLNVEPFSFFQVRKLAEMGPWADLNHCVEIASLEVQP